MKCEARDRSGSCCHAGSEDSEDSEGLAWSVEPHWGCMGNLQKQPWRDQLGRSVDRAWGRMWMDVDGCRFGVRKTMENSSNLNWKAKKRSALSLLVSLSISWIVCVSFHIFSYLTYFVSIFVSFSSYWGILAAFCDPRCRVCTFSALPKKFSSLRRLWNALTFSVYIRYWYFSQVNLDST